MTTTKNETNAPAVGTWTRKARPVELIAGGGRIRTFATPELALAAAEKFERATVRYPVAEYGHFHVIEVGE
jgi:hypothetical protein